MATAQMDTVIRHLRRTVLRQDAAGRTDGQLLASFIDQKDEAAFEALVRRHGPMVFGVCRRVVGNHHDAEDAFQATFLVLARKASSVRPRERVANWLHGVALRTAMKAKAMTAKRRGREKRVTEMPEPEAAQQGQWRDLQPLLDQELNGLPENYRLPILLCDLEGKTIKEAAQQLGWPQGSLAGRLARARKLLAKRLASRGVVLSAGSLAMVFSQHVASAGVPTSLMSSTVKAAAIIAAGQATVAGVVPAKVAALMEGVMKGMMLTKLSNAVAGLVVLGAMVFGGSLFTHCTAAGQQPYPAIGQTALPEQDAGNVAAAGGKQDAPKTDLDRLQGIWSVVSMEQGGKPAKLEKAVFMVDGKRACWQTSDSEIQGGLYLDPTSKPKTYDLAMSTRTMEGIYSLEGDNLRLCYDMGAEAKRPVGFTTKKESQQILIVLKRTHGPEVFPFRLHDGTRAFPPVIEMVKKATPPAQNATTPKDKKNYDFGLPAPGRDEPPAAKNQHQSFPVRVGAYPELARDKDWVEQQLANINTQRADRDFRIAEFYQRTGHNGSAYFYYELVCRRYAGSPYATKAAQRKLDLKSKVDRENQQQDFPVRAGEGQRITVPVDEPDFPVKAGEAKRESEEPKKLQGSWTPVSWELFGEKMPNESLDIVKITFKGDKVVFNWKNNPTETFTYKIDADLNSHRLNLVWSDGPLKGKTTTVVYQIDEATLRLSYGEAKQAPGAFTLKRLMDGMAKQSQ